MRHAPASTTPPTRRARRCLPIALVLVACLGLPFGAAADPVLDQEVSHLLETAKNLAIAAATKGNSVRGASGYLDSMLRQSDQLICNSWILGFSLSVRRMAIDLGDSPSPEELEAYQAMVNLRDKIVEKCGPITDPDTHAAMRGGAGAAAEASEGTETEAPSGRPFVPRKNWNIVDQICWDQCSRPYYAYRSAAREAEKRNAAWEKARRATADAKKALDTEKAELTRLEAEAKNRQAESDRIQDRLRPARGASRTPLVDQLGETLLARNRARAAAGRSREAITRLRKAWKKAQQAEATAASLARRADADANSALRAYHECVKRCYASARSAGQSGAARDALRDNPNAPYTSGADRRKMLERLREMREQEEARSVRETARQAQGSQALLVRPSHLRPLHSLPVPAMRPARPSREPAVVHETVSETPREEFVRADAGEPEAEHRSDRRRRRGRAARPAGTKPAAPATAASPSPRASETAPAEPTTVPETGRMIQVAPPVLVIPAGPAAGGR